VSNPDQISMAMVAVCDLALSLGFRDLNKRDDCWEHQIDANWWVAVNGRKEPTKCSHGLTVHPYQCYIEFNGFPAGIIDPYDGIIAAGDAANEDSFIEAVKAATNHEAIAEFDRVHSRHGDSKD
jgi:hypothetical protein